MPALLMRSLLLCAPALLSTGCFSVDLEKLAKDPPAKRRFLLDVPIERAADTPPATGSEPERDQRPRLLVARARAASPYDGRPFVYRLTETEHRTDFYHEFLISPADQIADLTRGFLRGRQLFPVILGPVDGLEADLVLHLDITELRGDFRIEGAPKAALGIDVALERSGPEATEIVFRKHHELSETLAAPTPEALVAGYSVAVRRFLEALAADLAPFAAR